VDWNVKGYRKGWWKARHLDFYDEPSALAYTHSSEHNPYESNMFNGIDVEI